MSMIFGALVGKSEANNWRNNQMQPETDKLDRKCRFFALGHCKFDDLCDRSHDPQGEVSTTPTVAQLWQHTSTVISANWRDRGGASKGKRTIPTETDTTTAADWRAGSRSYDLAPIGWAACSSRDAGSTDPALKGADSAEKTNTRGSGSGSSNWRDHGYSATSTSTSTSTRADPFGWDYIDASACSNPSSSPELIANNQAKRACFSWGRTGTCQFGSKCRYDHDMNVSSMINRDREAARENETRLDQREARDARNARMEEDRRARETAEAAQKAQEDAVRQAAQVEARRVREAQLKKAQRTRQAEKEARMAELAMEEAAVVIPHIVLDFTVVTFSAGLVIQDILLGSESCRIKIKNLPIDATIKEVCELFTQQGIEPGRFHVLKLARTLARQREAFLIGHNDLKIVAIGLEEIDFRQERLSFEITNHSGGDGMTASALSANTHILTWRAPLNRLIEASLNEYNVVHGAGVTGEAICPICYDAVAMPVKLGCGHAYCGACIRHFLTSTSTFPLVCVGDEDRCHVPIPILVIQRFLSIQQFTTLLETAFITHIDHHPQDFKYCTTPDCRQVYRCTTSDAASVIHCPSCLSSVCSACCEEGHEGMTCEDRKFNKDPEEQERLNDEFATQSGFKKCPQCAVWIEKTEGCNHMACKCGAHICWVCMGIFDAASVYQHMHTTHGGIDDVNENGAEPLFQRENFAEQQEALLQVALRRAQLAQQQLRREAEDEQDRLTRAQQLWDARVREQARVRDEARRQEELEARARIAEFHRRAEDVRRAEQEHIHGRAAQQQQRENAAGWGFAVVRRGFY